MDRGKVGFLISSGLVLLAACIIPIFMNNDFESGALVAYIIAKVLICGLLLAAIIYNLVSSSFNGSKGSILLTAGVFQFVPLALRYILKSSVETKYVWYIVILVVTLAFYTAITFGLSAQNKKMLQRDEISQGKEIEVKEEKRLATDNKED